jgi:MSHA biogenesis protein MshP
MKRRQQGFGAIMALIVLVLLAGLAAAIISISSTQQITITQDVLAAKADQAARAGTEWGAYMAFNKGIFTNGGACTQGLDSPGVSQTLDMSATNGAVVTVWCWANTYGEGEQPGGGSQNVIVYHIRAIACTANTPADNTCPGPTATSPTYVERRYEVVAVE